MSLLELSRRILAGETPIEEHHPFAPTNALEEVAEGCCFVDSFANVSCFDSGEALSLVDTGSIVTAAAVHAAIRRWSTRRAERAVYTHGHIDHVFGTSAFEAEATLEVVAHEAVNARFDRYIRTAGYNATINRRQFRMSSLQWPVEYRRPDRTYRDRLDLRAGELTFELHHARGETDDHTWVWVPERRVLCTGDLFIWCSPNAGNPQKVQRYPDDWAVALREMAELGADVLLPGHGLPIAGRDQVRTALLETAELCQSLVEQTLALMNGGARLDTILHTVAVPAHLAERPYLRPIYDEPEFIVRNVWRLYGGWYDGNPAHLKPAPEAVLAAELAALAGGAAALAGRALDLAREGDLRTAGHLVELAALADPGDPSVHRARAEVFGLRAGTEPSLMARGVFAWAEDESRRRAAELDRGGAT